MGKTLKTNCAPEKKICFAGEDLIPVGFVLRRICNHAIVRFSSMKQTFIIVAAVLSSAISDFAAEKSFDVRDFGAKGDGQTLDTAAIQKALDACGQSEGGTVILTSGNYLSGSLKLSSKTTLRIEGGAALRASTNQDDYDSGKVAGK
jgi:polygalacturonase